MADTFAARLRQAMNQANMKQLDLAEKSGAPRSAISQYLAGKNMPGPDRLQALADATGVSAGFLSGEEPPPAAAVPVPARNISTAAAARCLGKSSQFVRIGLQRGLLPFGSAVPGTGSRISYYINPERFREYVGAKQFDSFFGLSAQA